MSHIHEDGCNCSTHPNSTAQTLSELEFERGIWTAAIENDREKIIRLLDMGHDPNKRDNSGYTALHYAARGGHNQILTILLSRGADPNSQTPSGKTIPLHRAAYMGHQESVKILLINGSRPDWADSDGKSPLHKCAEKGHYMCAKYILDECPMKRDELVNMRDNRGNTAFELSLKNNKNMTEWNELLSKK